MASLSSRHHSVRVQTPLVVWQWYTEAKCLVLEDLCLLFGEEEPSISMLGWIPTDHHTLSRRLDHHCLPEAVFVRYELLMAAMKVDRRLKVIWPAAAFLLLGMASIPTDNALFAFAGAAALAGYSLSGSA